MYDFWYDYVKTKYSEKPKLCYIHTDNFIVYIKADDIYKRHCQDVETRFEKEEIKCNNTIKQY